MSTETFELKRNETKSYKWIFLKKRNSFGQAHKVATPMTFAERLMCAGVREIFKVG